MNPSFILISSLHILAGLIWVGGMFFAYRILRPSALSLEPPQRLALWNKVFGIFFKWVWVSIAILLVTGYVDVLIRFNGFENAGLAIRLMHGIGWLMVFIFAFLYFSIYKQFKAAVETENFAKAGQLLNNRIKPIIAINLTLGIIEFIIGTSGIFWGV